MASLCFLRYFLLWAVVAGAATPTVERSTRRRTGPHPRPRPRPTPKPPRPTPKPRPRPTPSPTLPVGDFVYLELFRAAPKTAPDVKTPANVNLYDAPGLIKYLSTEVVPEAGAPPERQVRRDGVDTIFKYTVLVRNPGKHILGDYEATQFEFGPLTPFVDGKASSQDAARLAAAGDFVGIQANRPATAGRPLGDPRFSFMDVYYMFSLPGVCPNLVNADKQGGDADDCITYNMTVGSVTTETKLKGGLCPPGQEIPTGEPGCTYVISNVKNRSVDELVGISSLKCRGGRSCTNFTDFHFNCDDRALQYMSPQGQKLCKEYDILACPDSCFADRCFTKNDTGIPFWLGRCNAKQNLARVDALEQLFGGRKDYYAENPPCSGYEGCQQELQDTGLQYCNRDASGICDICYIPGAAVKQAPPEGQLACRRDLFSKAVRGTPEYSEKKPNCAHCDTRKQCADRTDEDKCCLYTKLCTRDWTVGSWSNCNSTCGNGTRTRSIGCPFEDVFGPCEDDKMAGRPSDESSCRGTACLWDTKRFGKWSRCNNTCGEGVEERQPICDCPDDCPGGDDECADSPLPTKLLQRRCYTSIGQPKTSSCAVCAKAPDQCDLCLPGFILMSGGACVHWLRAAAQEWRLSYSGGVPAAIVLGDVAAAWYWADAFAVALGKFVPASIQVEAMELGDTVATDAEDFLQAQSHARDLGHSTIRMHIYATPFDNTDVGLRRVIVDLFNVTGGPLVAEFATAFANVAGSAAPKDLVAKAHGYPAGFCPDGFYFKDYEGCAVAPEIIEPGAHEVPYPIIAIVALVVSFGVCGICVLKRRRRAVR